MRADWYGPSDEPIHGLIEQFGGKRRPDRGFPDVVAFWDDGHVSLQELKLSGKDALEPNNTRPRIACGSVGSRAELSVLSGEEGILTKWIDPIPQVSACAEQPQNISKPLISGHLTAVTF